MEHKGEEKQILNTASGNKKNDYEKLLTRLQDIKERISLIENYYSSK